MDKKHISKQDSKNDKTIEQYSREQHLGEQHLGEQHLGEQHSGGSKSGRRFIIRCEKNYNDKINNNVEADIKKALVYATAHIRKGNYTEVENIYKKILNTSPNHQITLFRYAEFCRLSSRLQDSEKLFRKIIQFYKNNPEAYNQLAVVLSHQNKITEAIEYFKKAIDLQPDYIEAYINLGSIYFRLNKLVKAKTIYYQALEINPNHILLLNNLATLYKNCKEFDKAKELYKKALEIEPNKAEILSNLGDIYAQSSELDKAEKILIKAQKLNPNIPEINANIAILYKKQSKYKASLIYAKKAYSLCPNNIAFKSLLADIFYSNSNIIDAIKLYENILLEKKNDIKVMSMLGSCYRAIRNNKKSIEYFRKILELVPYDENSIINIAKFCIGENPEISQYAAIKLLEETLYKNPNSFRIKHLLASLKEEDLKKCPKEYVEDEFNRFADSFDMVLEQSLGYKIPTEIYDTIKPHLPEKYNMLDLGCGTGLSGIPFKNSTSYMLGIDLSESMLKKASDKKIYNKLLHGDIAEEIDKLDKNFNLVISADTFIYVGDLDIIFSKIYKNLEKKGLFAFSTEVINDTKQYVICPSGRFKHSDKYIKELAKKYNFEVIIFKSVNIRSEGSEQVQGLIYLLQKK